MHTKAASLHHLFSGLIAVFIVSIVENAVAQTPPPSHPATTFPGTQKPLLRGSLMPYVTATVGGIEGLLLLDFGTTFSSIDVSKFKNGVAPKPVARTTNQFELETFWGPENKVVPLSKGAYSVRLPAPLVQAGIVGTDILSKRIFTLDYRTNIVYSAPPSEFYTENSLREKGFKPVSTAGYFANQAVKLNNSCTANVPTVPIRIGAATAVAQIDPGYDDIIYRHSMNINKAFLNSLTAAGIKLVRVPARDIQLTTCPDSAGKPMKENVLGYTLSPGQSLEIVGTDGKPVFITSEVALFLKDTPLEAKKCGGIGSWQLPGAQLGASLLIDAQQVIFDPFTSLIWFKAD